MTQSTTGVITVAFGGRRYVEMSIDLALSVKKNSNLPITLVTSTVTKDQLNIRSKNFFNSVIVEERLDNKKGSQAFVEGKLACLRHSPYLQTLFMDSDTILCRSPTGLLAQSTPDRLNAFGYSLSKSECQTHNKNGVPVRQLLELLNTDQFTSFFLCAFIFYSSFSREMANDLWERDTKIRPKLTELGDVLFDEVLFGLSNDIINSSFIPPPYNTTSYNEQGPSFNWNDNFLFIHSSPMRRLALARTMREIISNRARFRQPLLPCLFWFAHLLKRRSDVLGKDRYLNKLIQRITSKLS